MKVITYGEEGYISSASQSIRQGVNQFHKDIMINPNGLSLLHALGTLEAADGKVDSLRLLAIKAFHYRQINKFGGLLLSAISRPENVYY